MYNLLCVAAAALACFSTANAFGLGLGAPACRVSHASKVNESRDGIECLRSVRRATGHATRVYVDHARASLPLLVDGSRRILGSLRKRAAAGILMEERLGWPHISRFQQQLPRVCSDVAAALQPARRLCRESADRTPSTDP